MKNFMLLFCLGVCAASCNNTTSDKHQVSTDTAAATTSHADTATANNTTCYTYQTPIDSVQLTLTTSGIQVTGRLLQAFSGKDKNSGTINGTMKGDTLLADYVFNSEGKTSVRQVAFLKRETGFVEGYGDVKEGGNKMVFKNPGDLNFSSSMVLQKVPCH